MSLDEGDVVRFDYVLWVQGDDHPLETSQEDVAKEHGMHNPEKPYRPLTATIGGRNVLPALEAHLKKDAAPGKDLTIDLAVEDAYGPRDAARLKDIPMAQFRKQKVEPQVGMLLNYEGQRARVTRVAGGRVRLDMNHELAGKDLRYEIHVRDILTDMEEKLQAVAENLFPMGGQSVRVVGDAIEVEIPDQAKFDQQWPMMKFQVVTQIRQVAGLDKAIKLVETYPAMPEPEAEAPAGSEEALAGGKED